MANIHGLDGLGRYSSPPGNRNNAMNAESMGELPEFI